VNQPEGGLTEILSSSSQAASQTRQYEFGAASDTVAVIGTSVAVLRENLPVGLALLRGGSLQVRIDNRQAGDSEFIAVVRGVLLREV
jgi:hypothetical protein